MICKNCKNRGLFYLEQRSKETTDILKASQVALMCGACDKFVKWCPKNERRMYMAQIVIEDLVEEKKFDESKKEYIKKLEEGLKEACEILNYYSKREKFWFKDKYYYTVYKPTNFINTTHFKVKEAKSEPNI